MAAQKQIFKTVPTYRAPMRRNYGAQGQQTGIQGAGTSVGTAIGDIGGTIAKAIQSAKQNQVANQLLNTNWATPRAAWVGGTTPQAGVNTGGSAPASGGVAELDLRMKEAQVRDALAKSQASTANVSAQAGLRQQILQQGGGGGGGRSPWNQGGRGGNANAAIANAGSTNPAGKAAAGGKATKPAAYVPGSVDPQDPASDKFENIKDDINSQYGDKDAYSKLLAAVGSVYQNPDGTYAVKDGNPNLQIDGKTGALSFLDKNGQTTMHVPGPDMAQFTSRYDAARVKAGQQPLFNSTLAQQNAGVGAPGTQVNPFKPSSNLELRSLAPGSWFVKPQDGKVYQKPDPNAAAVPPVKTSDASSSVQPTQTVADAGTAPVDTAGQNMPVVNAAAPTDAPAQLAAAIQQGNAADQVTNNQVPPPDIAQAQGPPPGTEDDSTLTDAIKRAQAANAFT
jgi:hypothetical protein